MFNSVFVVREGRPRVVRRIDVDAFDLPRELLLQRLQREEVVAEDQTVVENVMVGDAMGCVIGTGGVLQ